MGQKKTDISSTDRLPGAGTGQQYHEYQNIPITGNIQAEAG